MTRKLTPFALLLVVWAALYFLAGGQAPRVPVPLSAYGVHPSDRSLPVPWSGASRPSVTLTYQAAAVEFPASKTFNSTTLCPAAYTVQKGETLGGIAKRCGLSIEILTAINPELRNPNRIYPGQILLTSSAFEPSAAQAASAQPAPAAITGGIARGTLVQVESSGLPANTRVRIGIGLSKTGFKVLTSATTDGQGGLVTTVTIPADALLGDTGFILVSTQDVPAVQAISDRFDITP